MDLAAQISCFAYFKKQKQKQQQQKTKLNQSQKLMNKR